MLRLIAFHLLTYQEIHRKIESLQYHNCHVKIRQIDSQTSVNGSVVIQVCRAVYTLQSGSHLGAKQWTRSLSSVCPCIQGAPSCEQILLCELWMTLLCGNLFKHWRLVWLCFILTYRLCLLSVGACSPLFHIFWAKYCSNSLLKCYLVCVCIAIVFSTTLCQKMIS